MRHEFHSSVKRAADERAQGRCEAVGPRYGLAPGTRCQAVLSITGKHYDHYPRGAHDPDPEAVTLGNCVVTCPACNLYAAHHTDTPREAKIKRVRRKHGLDPDNRKPRRKIANRKTAWPKRSMEKRVK